MILGTVNPLGYIRILISMMDEGGKTGELIAGQSEGLTVRNIERLAEEQKNRQTNRQRESNENMCFL